MTNALVLAAAPNNGRLAAVSPAPNEALIEIGGKPIIRYIVDALLEAERINRIVLLGPAEDLSPLFRHEEGVEILDSRGSVTENLLKGCEFLGSNERVLVVTSDIPLLTGEMVDDFISRCGPDGDFFYPIVRREVCEASYPNVKRTYATVREGTFTGGNIFLLNPSVLAKMAETMHKIFKYRKNPVKLCSILGWGFVLRFLLRRVTIAELEARVSELFGVRAVAVETPYVEIGLDVDKPEDYKLVVGLLGGETA